MAVNGEAIFREEQRPWRGFQALEVVICAAIVVFSVYAIIEQLILHRPVGNKPMSDTALSILGPAMIILASAGIALMCVAKLIIEVRHEGLWVRFVPIHLHPKRIALDQVTSVTPVTYRPILQYGGWGIRWACKGKAYNARGNRGVRLDYVNGRHLLLGSQRPEELAGAIERLRQGESELR